MSNESSSPTQQEASLLQKLQVKATELKDRYFNKEQEPLGDSETVRKANERVNGWQVVRELTNNFQSEHDSSQSVQHNKGVAAEKRTEIAQIGSFMERVGKGVPLTAPEQAMVEDVLAGRINPVDTMRQMRVAEETIQNTQRAFNELRGRLPDISLQREYQNVYLIRECERAKHATAQEIGATLLDAFRTGLDSQKLDQLRPMVRIFIRRGDEQMKHLDRIAAQMEQRYPERAGTVNVMIMEQKRAIRDEESVHVPETAQHNAADIAAQAEQMVKGFALGREENRRQVLEKMGVTYMNRGNGEAPIPQVRPGSFAERYFNSQTRTANLEQTLRATVESLGEDPIKAVGAYELAELTLIAQNQHQRLETQLQQFQLAATALGKARIASEIATESKRVAQAQAALRRNEKADAIYHKVAADTIAAYATVATNLEAVKTKGNEVATQVVETTKNKVNEWKNRFALTKMKNVVNGALGSFVDRGRVALNVISEAPEMARTKIEGAKTKRQQEIDELTDKIAKLQLELQNTK